MVGPWHNRLVGRGVAGRTRARPAVRHPERANKTQERILRVLLRHLSPSPSGHRVFCARDSMNRFRRDHYDIWCTDDVDGVHGRRIGSWSTHYAVSAASPARRPAIIRSGNRMLVGASPTSGVLRCVGLRSAGHSLGVPQGRLRWQPRACPAMFEGASLQPVC